MAYPYYGGYQNPYYPAPMPDNLAQLRQPAQQTAPQSGVIWVQGEEAAKAYMVAAGNSVLLMDSEASTFYLKSTDQSGMPQPLRVFDYTERTQKQAPTLPQTQEYVTRQEFDALAAKLEALTAKPTKKGTKEASDDE
nr:MAG TPA: hypothetical protein [Caudoviricetes sp.]